MTTLLHFKGSTRPKRSHSHKIAEAFIEAWKQKYADGMIENVNPWTMPMEPFDEEAVNAKFAVIGGQGHTPEQAKIWETVKNTAALLEKADILVFSIPMWNFGIPYRIKHFIDIVTQPGILFNYDPGTGYVGLLKNKRAVVTYARSGEYPLGSPIDFQRSYIEFWLKFIGIEAISTIVLEGLAAPPEEVSKRTELALSQARELAQTF